jgi:hypothetical protein
MKRIIIFISIFFYVFILPYMELFAETYPPLQVQLSDSLNENYESEYEKDSMNKTYLNSGDIHEVNFQKYLNDMDSECMDIDSNYTVGLLYRSYITISVKMEKIKLLLLHKLA